MEKHIGLFSVGLHICHSMPDYPQFVVFWVATFSKSWQFAALKKRLHALGYEVSG